MVLEVFLGDSGWIGAGCGDRSFFPTGTRPTPLKHIKGKKKKKTP
jgi:hypothetical protein